MLDMAIYPYDHPMIISSLCVAAAKDVLGASGLKGLPDVALARISADTDVTSR